MESIPETASDIRERWAWNVIDGEERTARMIDEDQDVRLSRITTRWSLIYNAHRGELDDALSAQAELVRLYAKPVYQYLLGATHQADVAEELSQEFVVRLLDRRFQHADPDRGRFRHYLKSALANMLKDHFKSRARWPKELPSDAPDPTSSDSQRDAENRFIISWRQQVLDDSWRALRRDNRFYFDVLRLKVDEPERTSAELADQLSTKQRHVSADVVRKTAQRAQRKYAELMIQQVAATIEDVDTERLRIELEELDLLRYCEKAVARWSQAR